MLAAGILVACLCLLCELALPWLVGAIIDDALSTGDRELLASYTVALAAGAVGLVVFWTLSRLLFAFIGGKVLLRLHREMLSKAQALPLESHQETRVGEVVSLFTGDAVACSEFYENELAEAIHGGLQVLATLVVLFALFPEFAAYLVLAVPLYVLLTAPLGKPTRKASRTFHKDIADIGANVQESLSAVREIKAFNREKWNLKRLNRPFRQVLDSRLRLRCLAEAFNVNVIAFWIMVSFVYWYGGLQVMAAELTIGKLVAVLSYCRILQQPFIRIVNLYSEIQAVLGAADRIEKYLSRNNKTSVLERKRRFSPGKGGVEIEGVSFVYDHDKPILQDLNLTVHPGQRMAIVGPSGSGKSTLLLLLLGLYQPTEGRIRMDGQDIQEVDCESFRENIGVVFEETLLFSTTIQENIRFGRLDASDQEVIRAAQAANAHEFIQSLSHGYETHVGERGIKLSNGQKQRLSIARAVLRNPRVLLLDEATSALDTEAEKLVGQAVTRLMKDRTTISVSHRLWTVRDADTIAVLERGRLIDSGTHEDLLGRCRLYRRLLSIQTVEQPFLDSKSAG